VGVVVVVGWFFCFFLVVGLVLWIGFCVLCVFLYFEGV
jgi:hypothetical protein